MNGRIYDPQIGRFLSADKFVQFPGNLQSYNRYSYVQNNPLTHTDSTGELIDTIWDVGSAIVGVIEVGANLYAGDWGEAAVSAGGVVVDVGAAFVPFVPGGASIGIKAAREGAEIALKEGLEEAAEAGGKRLLKEGAAEADRLASEAGEAVAESGADLRKLESNAPKPEPITKIDKDPPTGGPHRETSQPARDGYDSHHMPADSVTNWKKGDGPAIKMDPEDHKNTMSWGSGKDAKAYREHQKELIDQGKVMEAFQMDVDDIRSQFGNKYDDAIEQTQKYLLELLEKEKDNL